MKTLILKDVLDDIYIDWFNNFLTIERYAEYHEIEEDHARTLINMCRNLHHKKHQDK